MFAGLLQTELQIKEARDVHASAVEAVQASYYDEETIEKLNAQIHQDYPDSWILSIQEVNTVGTRKDYLVTLHYEVDMPFFGINTADVLKNKSTLFSLKSLIRSCNDLYSLYFISMFASEAN